MSLLEKNKDFLDYMCKCIKKERKKILKIANKNQINSICEIVLNLLRGNLNLTIKQRGTRSATK